MKKKINLICLPFAGGNKYSYRSLFRSDNEDFNATTLEYTGRGSRFDEELISDINLIVDDLYVQAEPILKQGEYAIYGHSLGGLIAYLLSLKILASGYAMPVHLFITGAAGPSAPSRSTKFVHLFPQQQFVDEIMQLGGMPNEIFADLDMLHFFEPIIRNDFKVSETYVHNSEPPLNIPVTVITGTAEDILPEELLLWQKESVLPVEFVQMAGDHFFILDHQVAVNQIIASKLSQSYKIFSHEG